ncbi:MAG: FAD-binding oxidoreductase [Burkholderiales bacterium]
MKQRPDAVDWQSVADALAGLDIVTDATERATLSRDYYWYSPILKGELDDRCADLVVRPRNQAEVMRIAALAATRRLPVTVRGGGTGNYGQAVPLEGGIVIDMTRMDRVLEIATGAARCEAGALLWDLDQAARRSGQALLMYPSTARIATVGGFIAGGHSGIGSIRHGILADPGNVRSIRVVTLEESPRVIDLIDADIQKVHHAYGTNGIITELTVALAPAVDWINVITCFDDYGGVLELGLAAGARAMAGDDIDVFLLSAVERRIMPYYEALADRVRGRDAMFALVSSSTLPAYTALAASLGGTQVLAMSDAELEAAGLPYAIECAYNHTTLTALKTDPSVTYLQIAFPPPLDVGLVRSLMEEFGDELYMHHEFARAYGHLTAFALPLVHYFDAERMAEIIAIFEARGCTVFNPHTYVLEDGGMKVVDLSQIEFKSRADPQGLMNPGKTRGWNAQLPAPR